MSKFVVRLLTSGGNVTVHPPHKGTCEVCSALAGQEGKP